MLELCYCPICVAVVSYAATFIYSEIESASAASALVNDGVSEDAFAGSEAECAVVHWPRRDSLSAWGRDR